MFSQSLYRIVGVMSGTSLDGLDIAFCEFELKNGKWLFNLREATTYEYSDTWLNRLKSDYNKGAEELNQLHLEYGKYIGEKVMTFLAQTGVKADYVASHGHTIFHQPENGFTLQVGHGKAIRSTSGIPVICDFRSGDVALGGQGAPLVPIGDKLLFSEYDACLNFGGFSNISFEQNDKRIAFDICPVNMGLNYLSNQMGYSFDKDGELAQSGTIEPSLLEKLNNLDFYVSPPPKSLGKEWFDMKILPILQSSNSTVENQLRTFVEHIAQQCAQVINSTSSKRVLVTGGGGFNTFLIERLREFSEAEVVLPEKKIIEYKEALIFGFLGVLKLRNEINCLSSVTGAKRDSSGGTIFL